MGAGRSFAFPPESLSLRNGSIGIRTQKRILCYGDSLTIGFCAGGTNYSPYSTALRETLSCLGLACDVQTCGINGLTAAVMVSEAGASIIQTDLGPPGKGLARILEESGPFDLVILMAGTNDLIRMGGVQSTAQSICQLHAMCHSRGVPTMMLAPPYHSKKTRAALSRLLKKWSKCVPQVMAFIDPEHIIPRRVFANWDVDGIHFSTLGSRTLGVGLGPEVAQILDSRSQLSQPTSFHKQAPASRKQHVMSASSLAAVRMVSPVCTAMTMPSSARPSTFPMRALSRHQGRHVSQVHTKVVRRPFYRQRNDV